MLSCRACLWRCIRALDTTSPSLQRLRRDVAILPFCRLQKAAMRTEARSSIRRVAGRPEYVPGADKLAGRKEDPWKKSTQAAGLKKKERKGLTRQPAPTKQINRIGVQVSRKVGRRDPSISSKDWRSRKMELQYITDPLELADFVKKELNKDKTAEMLQLVRMASNSMQCIVSWNHIIDYYLIKGWVSRAVKIYNEMKKRAQFPDAYTYTILLRGLAANAHESGAMEKALSIYHSLSTPNSRVQPSIIHTNAMLKVCARAANMDALWGVAAKVPENGPGAATPVTFVTILNAIRQSLLVNVPVGETEEQVARRREEGIMQGRRIWEDVIGKWRNADLVIEEELVCAMGRLLLIGTRPRDWDDVLSLVEQTMDIPRLVPRLGSPARKQSGVPNLRAPNVPEEYRVEHHHLGPSNEPPRGGEFLPIVARGIGSAVSNPLSYATPSNSTLSLVQEACQKIVGKKAGDEYWNLLTDPTTYGIVPDVNNIHQRLRILRQSRASGEAVELLDSFILAKEKPSPGTFRIAMSTCGRDKNNHNSLKYASQILETMKTTLEDADAKTVTMYAKLAIDFPLAKGTDLLEALARLNPIVRDLRLQLGIGRERKDGLGVRATLLTGQGREDAIEALKKIHGLFDRLINSNMIAEEQKRSLRIEKARLSAYLNKLIFKSSSRQDMKPDIGDDEVAPDFKDTKDDGDKERGGFKGLINGTGAWRKRNALPEGQRKPWFSPAERSTA